ncbi:MAG TPA: hypothetical protein VJA21_34385 [Verrucomicrobiae bacterium]
MLRLFPVFAVLAVLLLGVAWYRERTFSGLRYTVFAVALSLLVSVVMVAFNPGGYLSWFLS